MQSLVVDKFRCEIVEPVTSVKQILSLLHLNWYPGLETVPPPIPFSLLRFLRKHVTTNYSVVIKAAHQLSS